MNKEVMSLKVSNHSYFMIMIIPLLANACRLHYVQNMRGRETTRQYKMRWKAKVCKRSQLVTHSVQYVGLKIECLLVATSDYVTYWNTLDI